MTWVNKQYISDIFCKRYLMSNTCTDILYRYKYITVEVNRINIITIYYYSDIIKYVINSSINSDFFFQRMNE